MNMATKEPHDLYQDKLDSDHLLSEALDALPESVHYHDFIAASADVMSMLKAHLEAHPINTNSTKWYSELFTFALGVFDARVRAYVHIACEFEGGNETNSDLCWFVAAVADGASCGSAASVLDEVQKYLNELACTLSVRADRAIDKHERNGI
jgi:hypothetical protein